ncbi:toll/interleukin-1 receptor domain-containing protein [Spirosoma sp. KCTC 42546]|uniref:toll/interleukin-1 receptor domain-containing protein n=1 Tax=Spirosoma sp. KCTC 42546 TaxID=2520506 RepID=UPI001158550C|nr:toll/interleukin-1 receptor domain-containing protein [Spirosoma sp. KCTC 42546]QDK77760.1 toll/interleukin-1 receptor domain-containing protein [Spirosoma sp. KCTC 42546]
MKVFLSHNSADKLLVEIIGDKLRKDNLDPWLDKWNLVPGDPWQEALEEALDECQVCIVFFGKSGIGPWQNEEMRSAIEQRVSDKSKAFKVIPVLLPGVHQDKDLKIPRFIKRLTWVNFSNSIDEDEAYSSLLWGITGVKPVKKK